MNNWNFALPASFGDWDVSKFTKEVQTKAWVKRFRAKLDVHIDRLTNANSDKVQVIGGMLQSAYGVNIGRQIEAKLSSTAFDKIKRNILEAI